MTDNMQSPSVGWHEVVFDPREVDQLEQGLEDCQDQLIEWFNMRYDEGVVEFESPESIALAVGNHAESMHTEHVRPVLDDFDETGKKLAKGYIGAKTIEQSD